MHIFKLRAYALKPHVDPSVGPSVVVGLGIEACHRERLKSMLHRLCSTAFNHIRDDYESILLLRATRRVELKVLEVLQCAESRERLMFCGTYLHLTAWCGIQNFTLRS